MKSIATLLLLLIGVTAAAATKKIANPDELKKLRLRAGDTIVLRNGSYADVQLVLNAKGTAQRPVVFMAEEAGKVTIEGKSNLRIAGKYVEVHNLWFRNGYSPSGAVIEFRVNAKKWANSCRVTGCAIDYFNPPNRSMGYSWALLYGNDNRFDHNSMVGKLNAGATLAVALNEEHDRQNGHRIDHNYFDLRPVFGGSGAAAVLIGSPQQAHASSNTLVELNFFEQCNGEAETVSVSASYNIIRYNTFVECQGALTLRNGSFNTVENNLFVGNGVLNTGGVRVIGEGHTVRNNVFYRLTGNRFFAALAVMNAVPNSPQWVKDVSITQNTFVDCPNILLGLGKDDERTLAPSNVTIASNIFSNKSSDKVYEAFDNADGFTFSDNLVETSTENFSQNGFTEQQLEAQQVSDLSIPKSPSAGSTFLSFTRRGITGAAWLDKGSAKKADNASKVIQVAPGQNTLLNALRQAEEGDVIELTSTGNYLVDSTLSISKSLIMRKAESLKEWPTLRFNGSKSAPIITVSNGGNLSVSGLSFSGEMIRGKAAAAAAISTADGMVSPYLLRVDNCEFYGFFEPSSTAIRGLKNTFASSVVVTNSFFHDMSAEPISFAASKSDDGSYTIENLRVDFCTFFRIANTAVTLSGSGSEGTSGPNVHLSRCIFEEVNNREQGLTLHLANVANAIVRNSIFSNSGGMRFDEKSESRISVSSCNLWNSGQVQSSLGRVEQSGIANINPQLKDVEKYDFAPQNEAVKEMLR